MHLNSINNGKDTSGILGLVMKMTLVHGFTYNFFHTCLKIMKLVSLENELDKLLGKNRITQNGCQVTNLLSKQIMPTMAQKTQSTSGLNSRGRGLTSSTGNHLGSSIFFLSLSPFMSKVCLIN